jgi:tRNA(Ile)-lysidine synthase
MRHQSSHATEWRPALSRFCLRLLSEWKRLELPLTNARVVVAVSGGADSTALLLAIDELIKAERLILHLTVAHLNHGLRGRASHEDARWVASLSKESGHEVAVGRVNAKKLAARNLDNLEQTARRARYEFLAKTASEARAAVVVTGHTMDDQAETFLLNLLRGSGADGLGGMEPVRTLDPNARTMLARPLVEWARRHDTREYCRLRGVAFRIDQTNADERFARVRVRRQLLPLMQTFNSRAVEGLSRAARLLREESAALEVAATSLLKKACDVDGEPLALRADILAAAQPAVRWRALRRWISGGRGDLRRIELVHILAVERLLYGQRGGRVVELPGGARVTIRRGVLRFQVK